MLTELFSANTFGLFLAAFVATMFVKSCMNCPIDNKVNKLQSLSDREWELREFNDFQECPNCQVMNYHWISIIEENRIIRECRDCGHKWPQGK